MIAMPKRLVRLFLPLLLGVLVACEPLPPSRSGATHPRPVKAVAPTTPAPDPGVATKAVDLDTLADLDAIMPKLGAKRLVFVGEVHNRLEDHRNQLQIIRRLHALHPDMAIGMEYFQQPFQRYLDDYVGGRISEDAMLRGTEYFRRWGYDYRLYAPILRFARAHGIPLVALNLPVEITRTVGRSGLDSLTPAQRARIPQHIDRSDQAYRKRLKRIYDEHSGPHRPSFEHFYSVQLLWDEGMAARAARYLQRHPKRRLVVLAGNGHLEYGSGIPRRLTRRVAVSSAIVLNDMPQVLEPDFADFVLLSPRESLPPAGVLGVTLGRKGDALRIGKLDPGGAAAAAGLRVGDQLLAIAGQPVHQPADLRVAMWNKRPGQSVRVKVRRSHWLRADQVLTVTAELH
jgi:uncharacterized iron-regulated protein